MIELAECVCAGALPLSVVVTLLDRQRLRAYEHCDFFTLLSHLFVDILLEMEGLTTPVTVLKLLQSNDHGAPVKQLQVSFLWPPRAELDMCYVYLLSPILVVWAARHTHLIRSRQVNKLPCCC